MFLSYSESKSNFKVKSEFNQKKKKILKGTYNLHFVQNFAQNANCVAE